MTLSAAAGEGTPRGPVRVVGTGLLGTSLGLALRARGVEVELADSSPAALALAVDLGAGSRPGGSGVVGSGVRGSGVGGSGVGGSLPDGVLPDGVLPDGVLPDGSPLDGAPPALVVVAVPPDVAADVIARELQAYPGAVVTDVASVKAGVLAALQLRGAELSRYVGGHPMAGRERGGAAAARADLFAGQPWVVCPHDASDPDAVAAVETLARAVGGVVARLDPVAHDQAVALVSHVPQVLASLAAARLREAPSAALALAGPGVRDVTRIAASDPQLWTQILGANAGAVLDVLQGVRHDLDRAIDALAALAAESDQAPAVGARAAVAGLVAEGNAGQHRIPGKHGAPPTSYAAVPVVVPDRPGELARLLHDVGQAGVNLEDLHLEHSQGQPVGLAEVLVLPEAAPRLTEALRAQGWTVHEADLIG